MPKTKSDISVTRNQIEVDPEIYGKYIALYGVGSSEPYSYQEMNKVSKELLSPQTPNKLKQQILFRLAHTGLPEAYLLLNKFINQSKGRLQQWAVACLDECQMFIQDDIDEDYGSPELKAMISSSLGGDGQRLRCYIVLSTIKGKALTKQQKQYFKKIAKQISQKYDSKAENIENAKNYILFALLHSISLKENSRAFKPRGEFQAKGV